MKSGCIYLLVFFGVSGELTHCLAAHWIHMIIESGNLLLRYKYILSWLSHTYITRLLTRQVHKIKQNDRTGTGTGTDCSNEWTMTVEWPHVTSITILWRLQCLICIWVCDFYFIFVFTMVLCLFLCGPAVVSWIHHDCKQAELPFSTDNFMANILPLLSVQMTQCNVLAVKHSDGSKQLKTFLPGIYKQHYFDLGYAIKCNHKFPYQSFVKQC